MDPRSLWPTQNDLSDTAHRDLARRRPAPVGGRGPRPGQGL